MYQIPELLKFPKLFHSFSEKSDGNMDFRFDPKEKVTRNRVGFLSNLSKHLNDCAVLNVEHSNKIITATKDLMGRGAMSVDDAIKGDSLMSNEEGLLLFLLIADCLPVIIHDPVKEIVALVHVGWRGADLEMVKKVIKSLNNKFKSKSKDLIVGFGPAARKESYVKENPEILKKLKWQKYLEKKGNNLFGVDFVGLCKKQLIDSGVLERNIFDCGIDTIVNKHFFSHYRDREKESEDEGRFACIVGLK